jgi:hypothetical protein
MVDPKYYQLCILFREFSITSVALLVMRSMCIENGTRLHHGTCVAWGGGGGVIQRIFPLQNSVLEVHLPA